jgi:hypothetical protein
MRATSASNVANALRPDTPVTGPPQVKVAHPGWRRAA